jgi:hypothetical protein
MKLNALGECGMKISALGENALWNLAYSENTAIHGHWRHKNLSSNKHNEIKRLRRLREVEEYSNEINLSLFQRIFYKLKQI